MQVNIGLPDASRKAVAQILNAVLADAYVLYTKTRNYHWNVKGPHFHDLHKLFEAQYDTIDDAIDEIAERVRALGEPALGSMKDFLAVTRLSESTGALTATQMIAALLNDHEAIIRQVRSDIDTVGVEHGDTGNQDYLTGLMEEHEKMAWMLRSMLE
jgi:starvation-inducible DNA-binding protein